MIKPIPFFICSSIDFSMGSTLSSTAAVFLKDAALSYMAFSSNVIFDNRSSILSSMLALGLR